MASTDTGREISILRIPTIRDYRAPAWFERLPTWLGTAVVLAVLVAVSAFIRAHYVDGQLWMDEGTTVGIASQPLGQIFGALRHGGEAPFYYLLLHVWMVLFGTTEIAVHALSVAIGVLTIPVALWAGWSLFDRRVGYTLAVLFTFNAWLTEYAEEARMYELMALLGLIATAAYLHGFVVGRRRGFLWLLGATLALMLYTDPWTGFFVFGLVLATLGIAVSGSEERPGVLRDLALVLLGALVLYIPWLPTLIHQIAHATAPFHFVALPGFGFPGQLLGSDRVDAVLAFAVVAGIGPMLLRARRQEPEARSVLGLVLIVAGTVLLALLATLVLPSWEARLMGPVVAPLLLIAALGCARSGILGLVVLVVSSMFLANPASFIPTYKSDMKDVAAEVNPTLRSGDVVLVTDPEQAPLADYYLLGGPRYVTTLGPDPHPAWVDWDGAQGRLARTSPAAVARLAEGEVAPGGELIVIRPLTEGLRNWKGAWQGLVRRRSAQVSALIAEDPAFTEVILAPHAYRGSCCIAASAVVYRRR